MPETATKAEALGGGVIKHGGRRRKYKACDLFGEKFTASEFIKSFDCWVCHCRLPLFIGLGFIFIIEKGFKRIVGN